jgi:hypothetical protein
MSVASTVDVNGTWTSKLQWERGVLLGDSGTVAVERATQASARVLKRTINGVAVAMPESELEVNGKPLSFLAPQ